MLNKLFGKAKRVMQVEFCDSCSEVCSGVCRAEAHRERVRDAALRATYLPARF